MTSVCKAGSGTFMNIRAERREGGTDHPSLLQEQLWPGFLEGEDCSVENVLFLDCSWVTRDRKESCDGRKEELPVAGVCQDMEGGLVNHEHCA